MLSYLIILCLYSICRCLKLNLIDDYFVNVYVGDSKTKFKLLIDPTYPFTYLLKSYRTKTKKNSELKPSLFSNLYGNYSGKPIGSRAPNASYSSKTHGSKSPDVGYSSYRPDGK